MSAPPRARLAQPAPPVLSLNGKFTAQRLTGVQRHATELLRALDAELLAERGHALHGRPPVLWVPPGARPPPLRLIEVCEIAGPWRGRGAAALHLWEQWTLPRAARGSLLLSLAGSAPAMAARQIVTFHDAALWDCPQAYTAAFRHWYRWLWPHLARRADTLLTVSGFSQARLAQALKLPASRLLRVPGGSGHLQRLEGDAGALSRHGLLPGGYFLAVASANPSKNLPLLQRAHARFAAGARAAGGAPPRLVLVGGAAPRVFSTAGGPGVASPDVHLAGAVDDATLKALYTHALALVCPSLYEGFGLPVLEAMACGCPVVASNAASLPEVAGDAALLLDATDEAALAAALQRVHGDAALRAQLRSAGLARAAQWSWQASAQALLTVLERTGVPAGPAPAVRDSLPDGRTEPSP